MRARKSMKGNGRLAVILPNSVADVSDLREAPWITVMAARSDSNLQHRGQTGQRSRKGIETAAIKNDPRR